MLSTLAGACGDHLLDLHRDADHNRSVFTLAGSATEASARALAASAVEHLDLRTHHGVHPRFGVVDVVPFVALDDAGSPDSSDRGMERALAARQRFASWMGAKLGVPCFLYGPERTLVEVRRRAFAELAPDTGPHQAHPTAGACAVGARGALVAYNLWLDTAELEVARAVAAEVRSPVLRTLGLAAGGVTQVSCNLVDPRAYGPQLVYDAVADAAARHAVALLHAELVGLIPEDVLGATDLRRRSQLGLDEERTIEGRLARPGRGTG